MLYSLQYGMFEGAFGLSPYAEISLDRLSKIVQENKHNAIQKFIDFTVEQYFHSENKEQIALQRSVAGELQRGDFFAALRRALSRHLKKFARTIEELVAHRGKNGGGWEWLRGMMDNLERIILNLYLYIRQVESSFQWETCKFAACEERRSLELFRKDVVLYLLSVSNVVRRAVKEAAARQEIGQILSSLEWQGWQQRQNQADIELQMQQGCGEVHAKQKKKKRNKKGKGVAQEEKEELSEDEVALTLFLQSLELEQERERCVVSEEWVARISPSSFFKK